MRNRAWIHGYRRKGCHGIWWQTQLEAQSHKLKQVMADLPAQRVIISEEVYNTIDESARLNGPFLPVQRKALSRYINRRVGNLPLSVSKLQPDTLPILLLAAP